MQRTSVNYRATLDSAVAHMICLYVQSSTKTHEQYKGVNREHREYRKRERTTVSTAQDPVGQLTTLLGPLVDGRRSVVISTRVYERTDVACDWRAPAY